MISSKLILWARKNLRLGKEKFFPGQGKIKVGHDSRKEALLINILSFTKM